MASTALRLLVRMMDGDQPEGTRTELSTRLVERGEHGGAALCLNGEWEGVGVRMKWLRST
jgi:light-regulated signal transduction histidine kinase (bacteriophytochrome)